MHATAVLDTNFNANKAEASEQIIQIKVEKAAFIFLISKYSDTKTHFCYIQNQQVCSKKESKKPLWSVGLITNILICILGLYSSHPSQLADPFYFHMPNK